MKRDVENTTVHWSQKKKSKSLKVFHGKHPSLRCYRSSLAGYRTDEWLTNVPLYALPVS